MGISVLLLNGRARDVALDLEGTAALADLGITYAAMFRHGGTLAVILDGRSFDPQASARTAADLILGPDGTCVELNLVAEVTVPDGTNRRQDVQRQEVVARESRARETRRDRSDVGGNRGSSRNVVRKRSIQADGRIPE